MAAPASAPARPAAVALGSAVLWRGETYLVAGLQGSNVHLLSRRADGEDAVVLLDALIDSSGFRVLADPAAELPGTPHPEEPPGPVRPHLGAAALLEGLPDKARADAEFWLDHVLEVHTGLPGFAAPGSTPRNCYDPQRTTLRERYEVKAAELRAAHHRVSAATVERKRLAYVEQGVWGLVDKRRLRGASTHGRVDERVVKLLQKVNRRLGKKSVGTRSRLFELLHRACVRKFKKEAKRLMPSRATFYRLLDRLGIRFGKEASSHGDDVYRPEPPFTLAMATTPGEQVQIDTTALDVLAVDETGTVVSVELTAAIDVVSRTILAAVIRPKSSGAKTSPTSRRHGGRATKAVDALLLLAEMCTPQPMRPHWSPAARAEGSGLPYAELVEADERMQGAAARPVIVPDMIIMDNGKVFAGRAFMDACAQLGISVRPACSNSPTHKAIIERTFGSVKSLFSQFLPGYTGQDLARRGKDVASERLWSVSQLNDFLQQWIAVGWQQRPHEALRNPYLPSMPPRTPNQVFAAHVAASGYVPARLSPEDRLRLLPTAWVRVTDKGIRLNNRTYDSRALGGYRNAASGWPGKGQRWPVRYHPHQPEKVWLEDHRNGTWAEADYAYQRLIGDAWTQYAWDQATAVHLEQGGSTRDEAAIARIVRALLERAGRGPARNRRPEPASPDRGMQVGPVAVKDPYIGIPVPDYDSVTALPSMDVDLRHLCIPPAGHPGPAAVPPHSPPAL